MINLMISKIPIFLLLFIMITAGCGAAEVIENESSLPTLPPPTSDEQINEPQEISPTDEDSQPVSKEEAPMILTDSGSESPGMENLIELAKADLADRLSIHIEQIELIEARSVTWPDASIGCPHPDMRYKQVPQDGAFILLQANGINYSYHSGGSRDLFLCENVSKKPPPAGQIDITTLIRPTSDSGTSPTPDNSIPPGEDD